MDSWSSRWNSLVVVVFCCFVFSQGLESALQRNQVATEEDERVCLCLWDGVVFLCCIESNNIGGLASQNAAMVSSSGGRKKTKRRLLV